MKAVKPFRHGPVAVSAIKGAATGASLTEKIIGVEGTIVVGAAFGARAVVAFLFFGWRGASGAVARAAC